MENLSSKLKKRQSRVSFHSVETNLIGTRSAMNQKSVAVISGKTKHTCKNKDVSLKKFIIADSKADGK